MIREGRTESVTLHIESYPRTVCVSGELTHPDTVSEALAQWNGWIGIELMVESECPADTEIEQGLVPSEFDEDVLGVTEIQYDLDTGLIEHATITMSSDFAYHRETFLQALLHELGHGAGPSLEDDPGPPATVDLRSIMSNPLDMQGSLTDHDREIVLEMMGE